MYTALWLGRLWNSDLDSSSSDCSVGLRQIAPSTVGMRLCTRSFNNLQRKEHKNHGKYAISNSFRPAYQTPIAA